METITNSEKMYQVSTLQALMLGYSRGVITVSELLQHGDTGLGTFENVDGEMILLDGVCYRATEDGSTVIAEADRGVPFSAVCNLQGIRTFEVGKIGSVDELKEQLNVLIEEHFGLNSMHMVRIDGDFELVDARSEAPYRSIHVTLKTILGKTQKAFQFHHVTGSLVCVYFPDYMDGINAAGWHLHFLTADRSQGGHVFELKMKQGKGFMDKFSAIELKLPDEPGFDTYALKEASEGEIKQVEQGKH